MSDHFYVASQAENGGVLHCLLSDEGEIKLVNKYPLVRPAYLSVKGRTLYVLLREPFMMQSGLTQFTICAGGELTGQTEPQPVHGTVSAYVAADGEQIYCANYLSGSVTLMPDKLIAFNGRGVDALRQDCSHPHCVAFTPDGKYICVTDLGTDRIYICTRELKPVSQLKLAAGSGPRHLVFSRDGRHAYCSNELNSTVSILKYNEGELCFLSSVSSIPQDHHGENSASAIRLSGDGRRVFVSNRGHGSVAEFEISGDSLHILGFYREPGASVRDFNIIGNYILSGDETGDAIFVFDMERGFGSAPVSRFTLKRPWCILPVKI